MTYIFKGRLVPGRGKHGIGKLTKGARAVRRVMTTRTRVIADSADRGVNGMWTSSGGID